MLQPTRHCFDPNDYPIKDTQGIDELTNYFNSHYAYIMSGASTHETDYRECIRKKPPEYSKKKAPKTNARSAGNGGIPTSTLTPFIQSDEKSSTMTPISELENLIQSTGEPNLSTPTLISNTPSHPCNFDVDADENDMKKTPSGLLNYLD